MRAKVIAGNWKMNCVRAEARSLLNDLSARLSPIPNVDVIVCPPFTALSCAADILEGSHIALGAQDVFWKERGAYTGQISPLMLADLGVRYVIVGHSEPRGRFGAPDPDFDADILAYFGDNDETVNRKLRAALAAGLTPICCVGETLPERERDHTDVVVAMQARAAVREVTPEQAMGLIFAYEPVWAIGTGKVCAPHEANRVCGVIRGALEELFGEAAAMEIRIQYGGSVNPANAASLLHQSDIDGALVGGASLKAADFAAIVAAAAQ